MARAVSTHAHRCKHPSIRVVSEDQRDRGCSDTSIGNETGKDREARQPVTSWMKGPGSNSDSSLARSIAKYKGYRFARCDYFSIAGSSGNVEDRLLRSGRNALHPLLAKKQDSVCVGGRLWSRQRGNAVESGPRPRWMATLSLNQFFACRMISKIGAKHFMSGQVAQVVL